MMFKYKKVRICVSVALPMNEYVEVRTPILNVHASVLTVLITPKKKKYPKNNKKKIPFLLVGWNTRTKAE